MQEGDVGASNSDLQTDRADDDVTHTPDRCVQKMAPCFQQETCTKIASNIEPQIFKFVSNCSQSCSVFTILLFSGLLYHFILKGCFLSLFLCHWVVYLHVCRMG